MAPAKHPAEQYADGVRDGLIPAGLLVRQAVDRYFDDLDQAEAKGFCLDRTTAEVVCDFFPTLLRHSKGKWSGEPFELSDWQSFIVWNLFGWKRVADGFRRYREFYIEVARKNGKTTFAAGIGLALFVLDGEPGAEIYTAATKKEQARIMHDEAKAMVAASPELSALIDVFRSNLSIPETRSKCEPLSADAKTLDGLNTHVALLDELHAHPNAELYDVLATSMGSRTQPMLGEITTAGSEKASICWDQHEHAERVLAGHVQDEQFFAYIAALDKGDAWDEEKNWPKANPNLGVSITLDYLRAQGIKAKQRPSRQNAFKRLLLNMWTTSRSRFLDLGKWNACVGPDPYSEMEAQNVGWTGYGGLDLATIHDIAAFMGVFPPEVEGDPFDLICRFWVPEEGIADRIRLTGQPFDQWIEDGYLIALPGDVIDQDLILLDLGKIKKRYAINEIAFDRWGSAHVQTQLTEIGFTMIEFGQGYASMSAPTKELERLVLTRGIRHGGHPVLTWFADNLEVLTDPAGNMKPVKPGHKMSHKKIDGMVALIMALARAVGRPPEPPPKGSVYEERGVREA